MTQRKTKLQEKRADQADLKRLNRITVTLEASELNLQKIAALLVFATVPYQLEAAPKLGPLPWEDPSDPRYQKPPELEIDYPKIRTAVMNALTTYMHGRDPEASKAAKVEIVALIAKHGGTKLSDVPLDNLHSLLVDIQRLNPETPNA